MLLLSACHAGSGLRVRSPPYRQASRSISASASFCPALIAALQAVISSISCSSRSASRLSRLSVNKSSRSCTNSTGETLPESLEKPVSPWYAGRTAQVAMPSFAINSLFCSIAFDLGIGYFKTFRNQQIAAIQDFHWKSFCTNLHKVSARARRAGQ